MIEFSGAIPDRMPMPFVMRTDSQIRNHEHGHFALARGQKRLLPIVFRGPTRANEWFFFDENERKYFVPARPRKIILRIYGGCAPGNALVYLDIDPGWNVLPSVKTVPSGYTLEAEH
jgi:hypothetical protein